MLPVSKSLCPADGVTKREETKKLLEELNTEYNGVNQKIISAMEKSHVSGW